MTVVGINLISRRRRIGNFQRQNKRVFLISTTLVFLTVTMVFFPNTSRLYHLLPLPSANSFVIQHNSITHKQLQYQQRRSLSLLQRHQQPEKLHNFIRLGSYKRRTNLLPFMSVTISSSVVEFILSPNETSSYYVNVYSNTKSNEVYSTMPKIVQNDEIWHSYTETMNEVIQREFTYRNRGALLSHELVIVQEYLLLDRRVVSNHSAATDLLSETRNTIRDTLNEQKELFMQRTNFSNPMYELYCRCLIYMNDVSAKNKIRSPVLPTWYKILECGLYPRENTITTCLYAMSMQQPTTESSRTSEKQQYRRYDRDAHGNEKLFKNACLEISIFHDLLYRPNEKTALVRIKACIADQNGQAAEQVLSTLQVKTGNDIYNYEDSMSYKRLRTYQPIYQYYCDTGNLIDAFRIYREMQHTTGVYLIAETYAMIISAAAKHGWFRKENELSNDKQLVRSKAMKQLKFRFYCGPDLLNELCTEMSHDVLELDESCAAMIIDGFNVGFNFTTVSSPITSTGWISDISQWFQRFLHSPANVKVSKTGGNNRRLLMERVSIDNTTALCPLSGAKLRLLTLSKPQIRNVHDSLLQMATLEQEKFAEQGNSNQRRRNKSGKSLTKATAPIKVSKKGIHSDHRNATYALEELTLFSDWLKFRTGKAYTAIIDGPNVAYYGHGDVRWCQVEQVLNKLEAMGEHPLVIMPQKYLATKFHIASLGRTQELSSSDSAFIKKLVETKKMYVVPANCLDDYYWMLSSVAEQKSQPKNVQQHVPTDDASDRFPGLRPLLVTNDQMRDHRLALLEPRLFRRWTSCHIVKYHIEPSDDEIMGGNRVTLFPADFFSREIQHNKAASFGDNVAWHFPISEWPEPDRLCMSVIL